MPLLAALEAEKDPGAWREMLGAFARIDTPEATNALVRLATQGKSLLSRRGHSVAQRLEVVTALVQGRSTAAPHALERIAVEGDAPLREAARKALESLQ
jgi:hypothetical protein